MAGTTVTTLVKKASRTTLTTLAMRPRMAAGRCVVLASGEVTFGLGRMFAAYRACDHETWLVVTRDRAEALAWLGLPPDAQPPVAGWVGDE